MDETQEHATDTMLRFMQDLMEAARRGERVRTSAGAERGRSYAYLEFHRPEEDEHTMLVLRPVVKDGQVEVEAHRLEGSGEEVERSMNALVH